MLPPLTLKIYKGNAQLGNSGTGRRGLGRERQMQQVNANHVSRIDPASRSISYIIGMMNFRNEMTCPLEEYLVKLLKRALNNPVNGDKVKI